MRIVHISDIHICGEHLPENIKKTEAVLKMVCDEHADHLVVTGDISHNANPIDYHIFRELLIKYNLYSSDKVSLVIGNHDIYGGVHLASDIFHFPDRCRNTGIGAKAEEFYSYFKGSFKNVLHLSETSPFPYLKIVDKVALIGLNSIAPYSLLKNPAASNGMIDSASRTAILKIMANKNLSAYKKIILQHHQLTSDIIVRPEPRNRFFDMVEHRTMRLYGRSSYVSLLRKGGIDLVLHGHVHFNRSYQLRGLKVLGGGGTIQDDHDDRMRINIIDIRNDEILTQILEIDPRAVYHESQRKHSGDIYKTDYAF